MVPFATVMTLPATGSEMNCGADISNDAVTEKFAFYGDYAASPSETEHSARQAT